MRRHSLLIASFSVLFLVSFAGCGSDSKKGNLDGSVKDRGIRLDKGEPEPDTGTPTYDFGVVPDKGMEPDLPRKADMMIFPDQGDLPDLSRPDIRVPDKGVVRDAAKADAPVIAPDASLVDAAGDAFAGDAPASCGEALGRLCTENGGECGPEAFCLLTSQTGGLCTCLCDPTDATQACPDPAQHTCGAVPLSDGTVYNMCFVTCQPKLGGNACTAPLACDPSSARFSENFDKAVCLFSGCTTNDECPLVTGQACTVGATPTGCGATETCFPLTSTGSAGVCGKAGTCDTASGLCGLHTPASTTAKVGSPCVGDQDCGAAMSCAIQIDMKQLGLLDHGATCSGGDCCGYCNPSTSKCEGTCTIHARNGYCVIDGCMFATATDYKEFACPTGSTCNRMYYGGRCMKECTLNDAATCRGNANDAFGDYECRSWDRVTMMGTTMFADKPVCDFGDTLACDFWGSSNTCADVGDATNSTNMRCQLLTGVDAPTPNDPAGFCLDDTSSGGQPAGLAKFGDLCDPAASKCEAGLTCLPYGATQGYCTMPCTTLGDQCPNTPAGTVAACLVEYQGQNQCMFLCKVDTSTWTCPSTTACESTPNPSGSTQYLCAAP
jgi:hypothetical protein